MKGSRCAKRPTKHTSARRALGLIRRGLANPAAIQERKQAGAGLRGICDAFQREPGEDAAIWRLFLELNGLTREALTQYWGRMATQFQEWMVSNPQELQDSWRGPMNGVLSATEQRQLALKLWLASTAKGTQPSDMRGRKLATVQSNPRSAFCRWPIRRQDMRPIRRNYARPQETGHLQ